MKQKFNYFSLIALIAVFAVSCEKNEVEIEKNLNNQNHELVNQNLTSPAVEGVVRVKLTKEMGDAINSSDKNVVTKSGNSAMDSYLAEIGAKKMTRVFPYNAKYEERTVREGLHLWYDIEFDESNPVTKVASDIKNIKGVSIVEPLILPSAPSGNFFVLNPEPTKAASGLPMNDPGLERQWHYNNTGDQVENAVAGADINLFNAWKVETGKSNIIVSVVDGGIDYTHEDLKDNMWINTGEIPGNGVDDDNNGFIDDVYGYNFVTGSGELHSESHGTHVAGTVSARNNNNIGVCGVAGGNGDANSGVKLMSCQVFLGTNGATTPNFANAIKYGADNGAVISQNSWGFVYPGVSSMPASLKEAIDYFTTYAGCDNNGVQREDSPMKGGIVIFAAGNDDKDYLSYPAAYEGVVAVSSMGPNFVKAYYSNRGTWVDIMAPGGEQSFENDPRGVYSTLPDNSYGFYQGTSMACPHVSGIAALMVSKYGGQGFTNETLREKLLSALKDEQISSYNDASFNGRLGRGYIDAARALDADDDQGDDSGEYRLPKLVKKLDLENIKLGEKSTYDLNTYFKSYDGSELTFTVKGNDETIATPTLDKGVLTISGLKIGECTVEVTAVDNKGGKTIQVVTIKVYDDSSNPEDPVAGEIAAVTYEAPNLILDVLEGIRYCQVSIYDANYKRVFNKFTYFNSNTDRLLKFDISELKAGSYNVYIYANDGKKQTQLLTIK